MVERAIATFGTADKPLLVAGTLIGLLLCAMGIGVLATRSVLAAHAAVVALGVVAGMAVNDRLITTPYDYLPVLVSAGVTMGLLAVLVARAPREGPATATATATTAASSRREFLTLAGGVTVVALAVGVWGRALHQGRAALEAARRNLRADPAVAAHPRGRGSSGLAG